MFKACWETASSCGLGLFPEADLKAASWSQIQGKTCCVVWFLPAWKGRDFVKNFRSH